MLRFFVIFACALAAAAPARAESLGAEAFVAKVLANNPRLAAERRDAEAADNRAEAAGAFADPMVSYAVAPGMLAMGNAVNAHQIEVEQMFMGFGKRGLERDMARAEAGMERAMARMAAQDLATRARMLFAKRARLKIEHDALTEQMASLEDLRRTTLAAIASGMMSQADALMVEADFHMVHEEQIANQGALARVDAEIDALAGEPVAQGLSYDPPEWTAPATQTTPRELPEVEAARSAGAEASAAERMARRAYLPDVTLFAMVNTMEMDRAEWVMAGVKFDLPVQRGRRGAEVAAARAREAAAKARVRAAEISRDELRRKALAELREAEERRLLYEETAIPLAERRLAAARTAYANGRVPIDAVIEAIRYQITARSMTRLMRVMSYEAQAELAMADGVALAGPIEGAP